MFYLAIAAIAWAAAQGLKKIIHLLGGNRRVFSVNYSGLLLSGGMPSAHSATVVAMMAAIGLREGFDSATFALAALFAAIVMYDAVMVRFSSGEQGDAVNKLISEQKSKISKVKVAHGHTPLEALAGAVLGAAVVVVVIFATK